MKAKDIKDMKAIAVRDYLFDLITALDELDCDDFFGPHGWRHQVMGEDE